MPLSNCRRCGTLFSAGSIHFCPECIKKEDESLREASDWIRDNPGRTINDLSEGTGIKLRQILKWVRQKRITLGDKIDASLCKRCGELVFSEVLCDRCKLSLSHDINQEIRIIKESSLSAGGDEPKGMHYKRSERGRRRG